MARMKIAEKIAKGKESDFRKIFDGTPYYYYDEAKDKVQAHSWERALWKRGYKTRIDERLIDDIMKRKWLYVYDVYFVATTVSGNQNTKPVEPEKQKKYKLDTEPVKDWYYVHDFTNQTVKDTPVYQIRALVDIPEHGVKKGMTGGYVASEKNLSHEGTAWIGKGVAVFGNAVVKDNAILTSKYRNGIDVGGNCVICENAKVSMDEKDGAIRLFGNTTIRGNATILDGVLIHGNEQYVHGKTEISGDAVVWYAELEASNSSLDVILITGNATVHGYRFWSRTKISGDSVISGNAKIEASGVLEIINSKLLDDAEITCGKIIRTEVSGNARLNFRGEIWHTKIRGKASIIGQDITIKDSTIEDDVEINSGVEIYESKVYGQSKLSGIQLAGERYNRLKITKSKIGGATDLKYCAVRLSQVILTDDYKTDRESKVRYYLAVINQIPDAKDLYRLYIPVRKIDEKVYLSLGGRATYLFRDGKITTTYPEFMREPENTGNFIEDLNHDRWASPTNRIRTVMASQSFREVAYTHGLAVIEVAVNIDDIYYVEGEELFVTAVKVIKEVRI